MAKRSAVWRFDDDQSTEHLFVVNLNVTQYLHYINSRPSKSFGISQRAWVDPFRLSFDTVTFNSTLDKATGRDSSGTKHPSTTHVAIGLSFLLSESFFQTFSNMKGIISRAKVGTLFLEQDSSVL